MLNFFQIVFEDNLIKTFQVFHIQLNITRRLQKIKYLKYRNINFVFTHSKPEKINYEFMGISSPVLYIYRNLADHEKKMSGDYNSTAFVEMIYSHIFDAFQLLWDNNEWNKSELDQLIKDIRQEKFQSIYPLFGPIRNIDKKNKATVYAEYFADFTNIIVDFGLGKKQNLKVLLYKATVDNEIIKRFIHHGFWNTSNHFIIQDELKEIEFLINPFEENVEAKISLNPASNSILELQGYLKALAFDTDYNERYRLLGIPI